jgi:DNA-directed RNA polymerase specialized sigma24 family protein
VTTNLCLNRLRDGRRRSEFLSQAADRSDHEHAVAPGETLHELLREVPRDLLLPAVYYYVEGLSHAEIAREMQVSRRTVGNRIVAFHALVRELQARASGTPKHVPAVDRRATKYGKPPGCATRRD